MDIKITVGTDEDLKSSSYTSKQKAVCCGAYVMSKASSEDTKVCSVWFQDKPEPAKAGKSERFCVKTVTLDGVTGESTEVPVNVVVVYR